MFSSPLMSLVDHHWTSSSTSMSWSCEGAKTGLEVQPQQHQIQEDNHFPCPGGHTILGSGQDAIGLPGQLGTAHTEPALSEHPQVPFCRAALDPLLAQPVALHGSAETEVQDPALCLIEPHAVVLGPLIESV